MYPPTHPSTNRTVKSNSTKCGSSQVGILYFFSYKRDIVKCFWNVSGKTRLSPELKLTTDDDNDSSPFATKEGEGAALPKIPVLKS